MKIILVPIAIISFLSNPLYGSMENIRDFKNKPFPGITMRTGQMVTPVDEQRVLRGMLMNEMRSAFQNLPEHIAKAVKRDSVVAEGVLKILPASVQMALIGSSNQNNFLIQPQLINGIGFEVNESAVARAQHLTNLGIKIYQAPLLDESPENQAYKKMMVVDTFLAAAHTLQGVEGDVASWDLAHRLDFYHSLGILHYWAACNNSAKNELIFKSQTYLGKAVNLIARNQGEESLRDQMLHVYRTAKIVHFYKSRLMTESSSGPVPLKAL